MAPAKARSRQTLIITMNGRMNGYDNDGDDYDYDNINKQQQPQT